MWSKISVASVEQCFLFEDVFDHAYGHIPRKQRLTRLLLAFSEHVHLNLLKVLDMDSLDLGLSSHEVS